MYVCIYILNESLNCMSKKLKNKVLYFINNVEVPEVDNFGYSHFSFLRIECLKE